MKTHLAVMSLGILLTIPARAQLQEARSAAAPAPALGAQFSAHVGAILKGISLESAKTLPGSLDSLRSALLKDGEPAQKFALTAAVAGPQAAQRMAKQAGLSATEAERLVKLAEHVEKEKAKEPGLQTAVSAARQAALAPLKSEGAAAAQVDAMIKDTVAQWQSGAPAADAPAPVVAPSAPQAPAAPVNPGQRPVVTYGQIKLPEIAMPSLGDNIASLWTQAHDAGPAILQAQYNFDDMDLAKSIVEKSKQGQKQVIVGDYSNWFPDKLSQTEHGGQHAERTEAMKYLLANMNPNIELHILKGLGSIGINHNKFTIFSGDAGELYQGGSFNYTKTSQNNHWENVVFSQDAERIAYFKQYHAWLVRRARKFSEDLAPQDPVMDPKDPIPQPPVSGQIVFHGVQFPKASFSPNGGTEGFLVKAESLVQQTLDILMFSPFPTPAMSAQIEALLKEGKPVRLIADAGQVQHAAPLAPLIDAGLKVKIIKGPDIVLQHLPGGEHSKQHEKVMIFDGRMEDGLVKMGDSLNISRNALEHNFENTQFWTGFHVSFMQAHFDFLWPLAQDLSADLLAKLREEHQKFAQGLGNHGPWDGKPVPASGRDGERPVAPPAKTS